MCAELAGVAMGCVRQGRHQEACTATQEGAVSEPVGFASPETHYCMKGGACNLNLEGSASMHSPDENAVRSRAAWKSWRVCQLQRFCTRV